MVETNEAVVDSTEPIVVTDTPPVAFEPPADLLRPKLRALNRQIVVADQKIDKLSTALKAEKAAREELVEEIRSAIVEDEHQPALPFGAPASANGQADDDSWRLSPLTEVLAGLSQTILDKLRDAEMETLGQLSDYLAADGGRLKLTDIAGIGEKKAEQIEAALERFWEKRKEAFAQMTTDGETQPFTAVPGAPEPKEESHGE